MPSEKILEQKRQQVAQLAEDFKKANVGVLVNYEGITVEKRTPNCASSCVRQAASTRWSRTPCLAWPLRRPASRGLEEHLHGATAIAYSENGYVDAPRSFPTMPRTTRISR